MTEHTLVGITPERGCKAALRPAGGLGASPRFSFFPFSCEEKGPGDEVPEDKETTP